MSLGEGEERTFVDLGRGKRNKELGRGKKHKFGEGKTGISLGEGEEGERHWEAGTHVNQMGRMKGLEGRAEHRTKGRTVCEKRMKNVQLMRPRNRRAKTQQGTTGSRVWNKTARNKRGN